MAITQEIDLNLIPSSAPVIVHLNQYDEGKGRIIAHLYNGSNPYVPGVNATVKVQGTKPDKHAFQYWCDIDGSTVTVDVNVQMTAVAGLVPTQLIVNETSGITGSFAFQLDVQASTLPSNIDVSETDLPILTEEAQEAARRAVQAAASAEESAEEAAAWSANPPYIGENLHWFVYDTETEQFVDSGVIAEGQDGEPGNKWYKGTTISGESSTPTVFPSSGIALAYHNDFYLNATEGSIYHCETPGDASTATWVYDFKLSGGGGGGGTYDYNDLVNQPKINNVTLIGNKTSSDLGLTQVNSDWNASSGVAQILNKPTLAAVATSGSYNDLNNKPTIPDAVAVKGDAESTYRTGNVNLTKGNIGLGNVGNFKAVSTVASQGLTDTEKSNARANIGAGTSSSDTKNTAGTTNSTSKLYLAGATSQAANPQTYSNANCYASGGALYSNSTQVATDGWTGTKSVDSTNQVTFTGLNDNYGYDLYCQNKLVGISAMTKTGSGTSVTLKFTLTGAASGDVCKLRIIRN